MSEEIKNHIYKMDETALEALAERNKDLETAIQFAAGEGLSQDELVGANVEAFTEALIEPLRLVDHSETQNRSEGPSTAYLDARLTLLEQAQTEFEQRVAKTFKEAGFKF